MQSPVSFSLEPGVRGLEPVIYCVEVWLMLYFNGDIWLKNLSVRM